VGLPTGRGFLKQVIAWVQAFALSIGGPGLFVVALLDSSVLSLPEINDLLVVIMVTNHPNRMVYYALMATFGSIAGCFMLYALGSWRGEPVLRKMFKAPDVDKALRLYRRYGVLAVVVPAILPPPAPFKIFVLLAGVARMPPLHFALAIAGGRGFRYFVEGYLAILYGKRAMDYVHENGTRVSVGLALLVLVAGIAYVIRSRRRNRRT
jgi:membrane protein YqaA with SNARE-associated domain